MDLDALARDVSGRFLRGDFSSPPFPPYMAHAAERERAEAERAFAKDGGEPEPAANDWPAFESFERVGSWRPGDLDVNLYRIEPTASALLLALRGDELAYAAFAGCRFMGPMNDSETLPPYDLAAMATLARARGELDLTIGGMQAQGDGPVRIAFEIEAERYTALDDTSRAALHAACTPVARDAALLFCGRTGPLVVMFEAPDPPQEGGTQIHHVGLPREAIGQFEVP